MTARGDATPATLTSADPNAERVAQLRKLFPDCFTEGKFDADKLKAALGDAAASGPERFTFSWAGRADAVSLLQTPSRATLVPKPDQSVNWDDTRNVFVEGDNLEVLKLLYKAYAGKVKLIYIDPPYNTGQDFVYPDDFADPLAVYLKLTGQAATDGTLLTSNPETSGRYHSAWLSMMYPRLFLARQLLRDDGVIFVSIDDHEVHHLRALMNEVFGEENFVGQVVWRKKYSPANDTINLATVHEYLLVFQRATEFEKPKAQRAVLTKLNRTEKQDAAYRNPDNDPRGPWKAGDYTCNKTSEERPNLFYAIKNPSGAEVWPNTSRVWAVSPEVHEQNVTDNRLWWGESGTAKKPSYKRFLSEVEGVIPSTWWDWEECGHTDEAKKEVLSLFGDSAVTFQTPKPTKLLKRAVSLATSENDIILDFFSGSGTLAQAVLELNREDGGNRRFVMVQLPEPTGNAEFPTIAEIGKERIRRVIAKLQAETGNLTRTTPEDLGFKVFALAESHFEQWAGVPDRDAAKYADTMDHFIDPWKDGADPTATVWELAVKEGYGLNSTVVPAQVGTNVVYTVADAEKEPAQSFRVCLDAQLAADIAKQLALTPNDLFVCRDTALDDTLAANLALQCRLKTV